MNDVSTQTIPIDAVVVGMFITELDIPWIDSPFLTHSRKIKHQKDIEALKNSGVKIVVIDVAKGAKCEEILEHLEASAVIPEPASVEPPSPPVTLGPQSLQQELAAAKHLRHQAKKVIGELFDALESDRKVNVEEVSPLIEQTLQSLERNNQALMSLVHLSRKSQKLADHAFSTYCLALNIGNLMKLEHTDLQALGLAALLHEAGWAQLPLNLMGKRKAYLKAENQLVQQHVDMGLKMLQKAELPPLVNRIIAEHHERNDGSGYPHQVSEAQLHPLSQVLAIADHYDERIHQLQDQPGLLPRNALRELYIDAEKGLFNLVAVKSLVSLLGIYPISSAVLLNTGEKALVLENCVRDQTMHLRVFYNAKGQPLAEPQDIVIPKAAGPLCQIEKVLDPTSSRDDPYGLLSIEF